MRSDLRVSGFSPTPRVTWKRLNAQMSDKVTYDSGGQELVLSSAEFEDAGRYQCEGSNTIASSAKDIILAVECKLKGKVNLQVFDFIWRPYVPSTMWVRSSLKLACLNGRHAIWGSRARAVIARDLVRFPSVFFLFPLCFSLSSLWKYAVGLPFENLAARIC